MIPQMPLNIGTKLRLIVIALGLTAWMGVLVLLAGTFLWPGVWIYYALVLLIFIVALIVLIQRNPDILKHRAEGKIGTVAWDKYFFSAYIILIIAFTITAGISYRYEIALLPNWAAILGLIIYIVGAYTSYWAMSENPHFETTVRIQEERYHRVISSGPYRAVRHPGYFGSVLIWIGLPLILGTALALGVSLMIIINYWIRTMLEDRFLTEQLEGYKEYRKQVKYRLFPGIW